MVPTLSIPFVRNMTAIVARSAMRMAVVLMLLPPFAAATELRSLKVATGELVVHPFEGDVPVPAESRWSVCQGAGPAFVPEGKGHRLNWNVMLKARGPLLGSVTRVTLEDVSGATAMPLFDGPPQPTSDGGLLVVAPGEIVSRASYPWLYAQGPTLLVLRVTLHMAQDHDKLFQPVLIGADVKRKLRDGGYLPGASTPPQAVTTAAKQAPTVAAKAKPPVSTVTVTKPEGLESNRFWNRGIGRRLSWESRRGFKW